MRAASTPPIEELLRLTEVRSDIAISLRLASSQVPVELRATRIRFHNLLGQVRRELEQRDLPTERRTLALDGLRALEDDDDFWQHQSAGLVVLATPDERHAFSVRESVDDAVLVNSRFELAPLFRDITTPDRAWLLEVTQGSQQLLSLRRGQRPEPVALELPADLDSVFQRAFNAGDADMPGSDGPEGDQPEQRRFCAAIQDAALARIEASGHPLVLAASPALEPAYRGINRYAGLLDAGLPNPSYQDPADLDRQAWELLDRAERDRLSEWRELFGTRRANGLATSRLQEVALAATSAAVDELLFNVDTVVDGCVDEFGVLHVGESAPEHYNVIQELAVRVLRSGGTVRGVRNEDLVDGSPVAAMLRFPVA